jgi:NitT/TauT family transport system substrate-binding protein
MHSHPHSASRAGAYAARNPSGPLRHWLAAAAIGLALLQAGADMASALTVSASQTALLIWIADARGYFKDQGLDVEVRLYQSGLSAANALIENQADISTTSDTGLVGLSFSHPDLRILAAISASETARLISRKDRGIKAPADLAGKRVGITLNSSGEYLLSRYLIMHGVPASAPVIVNLQPAEIAAALASGDIDAGLTWEPYIRTAEVSLGDNAAFLPDQMDQIFFFLLLTRQSWMEQNREQVGRFLAAVIQAEKFAAENPDEAKAFISQRFGYTQDYVDFLWPLHNLHVSLPQGLMFVLERQAQWQIRRGLAPSQTVPAFLDFVATAPLAELREASVGVVK